MLVDSTEWEPLLQHSNDPRDENSAAGISNFCNEEGAMVNQETGLLPGLGSQNSLFCTLLPYTLLQHACWNVFNGLKLVYRGTCGKYQVIVTKSFSPDPLHTIHNEGRHIFLENAAKMCARIICSLPCVPRFVFSLTWNQLQVQVGCEVIQTRQGDGNLHV